MPNAFLSSAELKKHCDANSKFPTKRFKREHKDSGDLRGRHWSSKPKQFAPQPGKATAVWKKIAHSKMNVIKFKLPGCVLPWDQMHYGKVVGNAQRALYIDLILHEASGFTEIIRCGSDNSFFGIAAFHVPASFRTSFDAGDFPSLASQRAAAGSSSPAYKRMAKLWGTAGFEERELVCGGLEYVYRHALHLKHKRRRQQ
mmetsp:Transcript_9596/g.27605  ORF Transcript_9596/g.27605 Transcript_9596/m.27605 type:complete len:200 (-) Transcript_9596:307-906(-)